MVRVRAAALKFPMAAILPARMPMSPEYHGEPVPSMMWPLVMTTSYVADVCACVRPAVNNAKAAANRNIGFIVAPRLWLLAFHQHQTQRHPDDQCQPVISVEITRHAWQD